MFSLAWPIILGNLTNMAVFATDVTFIGHYAPQALAAHALVMQLGGFTFMIPMGLSEAATIRVGLWSGRGDAVGVGVAGGASLALAVGFSLLTATVMLVFPEVVLAPFLDANDPGAPGVMALAARFLVVAALLQLADGTQVGGAGALRGLKDARMHMVFILTGHMVLALPTGVALAFWGGLGGLGMWIGFAVGLTCVAALVVGRWRTRTRLGLMERCRVATAAAA